MYRAHKGHKGYKIRGLGQHPRLGRHHVVADHRVRLNKLNNKRHGDTTGGCGGGECAGWNLGNLEPWDLGSFRIQYLTLLLLPAEDMELTVDACIDPVSNVNIQYY